MITFTAIRPPIRLPAAVVKALDLKEGDDVTVHVTATAHLEVEKTPDRREFLARKYRGRLPADFRFDRRWIGR